MIESLDFVQPKVMGILNVTPDSFFDGGKYSDVERALHQVEIMKNEGAMIIDIGGYSSRPGAEDVSQEEELKRVIPIVDAIKKKFSELSISVDTFRSQVALEAIKAGATIINDISGGTIDEDLLKVVSEANVYYVLMHMRGTPQTMTSAAKYENVIKEVKDELSLRIEDYKGNASRLIIDPGFGFAKTVEQNYELLGSMEELNKLGFPLLIGVSRKSMIYKPLNSTPKEALNGTTVLHTIALQKGASILRVHDVQPAIECIELVNKI